MLKEKQTGIVKCSSIYMFTLFSGILLFLFFTQCNLFKEDKEEELLARVRNNYLYLSDIEHAFPAFSDKADSIQFLQNYVNNWIQNKLVLETAKNNLQPEQMDFEAQLNEYKNSLIIYAYETEIVRQKLDTIVSEEDIIDYYNNNKENFLLKDNIVKVTYVKTPLRTANLNKIKRLYRSNDSEDIMQLRDICQREAVNYFLDDVWLVFSDLTKEIPIKTHNEEDFLHRNTFVELKDSLYNYFLHIRGYKIKESLSPLSLERENIITIIINKRKMELVGNIRREIFDDAIRNGSFDNFVK